MNRTGALFVACALLYVMAVASPALASPAYAPESALATGASSQIAPSMADFRLGIAAWQDDADGNWDVHFCLYGGTHPVAVGTSNQTNPVAADDYVVYEDDRNGDLDLYAYALSALQTTPLPDQSVAEIPAAIGVGDQRDPAADGEWVVFEDDSLGNWNIGARNLRTGSTRLITVNTADQVDPAIDGTTVVFADRRNGNWDIYSYDLARSKLRRLTSATTAQVAPSIGQGKVVYQDRRDGEWDIGLVDLATGQARRLVGAPGNQSAPQIDDAPVYSRPYNVVFVDDRNGGGDIYLLDGSTGIVKPVCTEPGEQRAPDINKERIAWTDNRDGQGDVFICVLDYPTMAIEDHEEIEYPGGLLYPVRCSYESDLEFAGLLNLPDGSANGQTVSVTVNGRVRTLPVVESYNASGRFTFRVANIRRKVTLRARYDGDAAHLPCAGFLVRIKPYAVVSRPRVRREVLPPRIRWYHGDAIPLLGGPTDYCIVSGNLTPRHPAGTRAITLELLRQNGMWQWIVKRTVRVKVFDSAAGSSYRARILMPKDTSWRRLPWGVTATHSDTDHTTTQSQMRVLVEE